MRLGVLFFAAASLFAAPAKKPITIDELVSDKEPPAILPVWSPDGHSVALQEGNSVKLYRQGLNKPQPWFDRKSLHAPEPAAVTAAGKPFNWRNRRASNSTLQWFPDNRDLLVMENYRLFIVHPDGASAPIALPVTPEDPQLAPNGKLLLYRSAGDLYVFDLASHQTQRITNTASATLLNGELDWVYPEELDLGKAVWWSPDSTKLAYLQFDIGREFIYPQTDLLGERAVSEPERYPQAGTPNASVRLGIVSAEGGATTWMKAGGDENVLLARVSWLPDSSKVALETMPRLQNALDLLLCDIHSGDTQTILHEASKTWINIADNLWWLEKRPEFLWTSERTGFRHIYRYSNSGELLGTLTNGSWQVSAINAVDESSGEVYYTSSEPSPLETHLAKVRLEGGASAQLTEEGFTHHLSVGPQASLLIDRYSNLTTPPELVLRDPSNKLRLVLRRRDAAPAKEYALPSTQLVTFRTDDGALLYGRLTKPVGFSAGHKYPMIVQVYGGPGAQSIHNEWQQFDMGQFYASHGYVVWQVDNRGSTGRGHAFEEPLFRNLGSVEVSDQVAGVQYVLKQGFVDPNRVGITGWSYGGYMTVRCLLRAPDVFRVGVAGAPVTDWHNYDTIYTERYMGLPQQNTAAYRASSNLTYAGNLRGKLFIQHNFEDDNVLFQNTMQLAHALELENEPYQLQLYPFKTHGVSGALRRPLYAAMLDFFDRNLKATP